MTTSHFSMYKDKAGKWRWRLESDNGRITGSSSQGYIDKADCETNAKHVARSIFDWADDVEFFSVQ